MTGIGDDDFEPAVAKRLRLDAQGHLLAGRRHGVLDGILDQRLQDQCRQAGRFQFFGNVDLDA
jgi:hypothetical protein